MIPERILDRPDVPVSTIDFRTRLSMLDLYGLLVLVCVTALAGWRLVGNGVLVGQDAATQFYPWYAYLGERLRDFDLPLWNPSQFSGAPFMADPQSGWTYLPAMVLFTLLPLAVAVPAFLMFHLALAGFGTYAFTRALGIGPVGALMAGIAYELSGPVYTRSVCCTAQLQVVSWVPIMLLGAELALHAEEWMDRLRWIVLAAVALSQIYASWLGQGSYYSVLMVSAFVVYRGIIDPPGRRHALNKRIRRSSAVLLPIGLVSLGLAAAGIIPRLEYNSLSNLAGGEYGGWSSYAAVSGGWEPGTTAFSQMHLNPYYMGGVVIALAAVAVVMTRGAFATPFFTVALVIAFMLSSAAETPIHRALYAALPKFEELHRHWPERLSLVAYLAFAVLAGAAVDVLPRWFGNRRLAGVALIPVVVAAGFSVGLRFSNDRLPGVLLLCVGTVVITLVIVGLSRSPSTIRMAGVALIVVATLDLMSANASVISNGPYGGFHAVDVDRYYQTGPAARYLQYRTEDEHFRYLGYDPQLVTYEDGIPVYYRFQFHSDRTKQLAVNNRATMYGIDDVQGYNPIQYQPYVEFVAAINGASQDYHDANIQLAGLDSPLLDLLNARFLVVPSTVPQESGDMFARLFEQFPVVFDDGRYKVLERESAMPRAWLVHSAVNAPADVAFELVRTKEIDPRTTVVLDGPVPSLEPSDSSADRVDIVEQSPERIVLETESSARSMLVLSEVDYPSWVAYVDGERVEISAAYGLLKSVEVPAGQHIVEFRYRPTKEYAGLGVTGITLFGIAGIFAAGNRKRRREVERL